MSHRLRLAVLGGVAAGLLLAPLIGPPPPEFAAVLLLLLTVLIAGSRVGQSRKRSIALTLAAALTAALAGITVGELRLEAIDSGAFSAAPGQQVRVQGFVTGVPRRTNGLVSVPIETRAGRLLVQAPEPVDDLPVGSEVEARGSIGLPEPWLRPQLQVKGIARVLATPSIALTGDRRGGIDGALDAIRSRAEAALDRGMPAEEAALARGFVLGQDDRISATTTNDFKASGLSHLLAVSGQNVMLLLVLALALLALAGTSLRARLYWALLLIAVYVPVAGGGPSIQRAGVMGAGAIAATLSSRPRSRAYILLGAVVVTLLLNPRASQEIGWQLSFAAVAGIALWARSLTGIAARTLGAGRRRAGRDWRLGLAEGFGVTTAATLATTPLLALHFELVSIAALPANLLALPAVAPVMWLGMLTAFAGQLSSGAVVEPLNTINSGLIAYIEQVAHWFGQPDWAQVSLSNPGWTGVAACYALLLAVGALAIRAGRRRAGTDPASPRGLRRHVRPVTIAVVICLSALVAVALAGGTGAADREQPGSPELRVTMLDVGQGDAILLDPPRSEPILVDGGPPGADLPGQLDDAGTEALAAVLLTHDQLDHYGGLLDVVGERPVGALLDADPATRLEADAAAAGTPLTRVVRGDRLAFGGLRVEVLWPPPAPGGRVDGADPNLRAIVLLARWRGFSILLTSDAEAESSPFDAGPVDVLKVSHHGSADAGLERLLEQTDPQLALISVGVQNPYGHPAPATLEALASVSLPTLRTDLVGQIELTVANDGAVSIATGG